MTTDDAVALLLERLGLTVANAGADDAEGCRRILSDALAGGGPLPTSWVEVYGRVEALWLCRKDPARRYDLMKVLGPLNRAVNTEAVPFPRDLY